MSDRGIANDLQCSLIPGLILLRADGELDPHQVLQVEAHLEHCSSCRARAESLGLADRRLLESRTALQELIPPLDGAEAEVTLDKILPNDDSRLVRILLWFRPTWAIQAVVLGLAAFAVLTVVTREPASRHNGSDVQPVEERTDRAAGPMQLDVPLTPVGDPFFDGSQEETSVRMQLAVATDGQPRELVLVK